MQFPGNIAIHTIIQKIKEETSLGEDHSLYDPERKRWLKMEKTLFYYDIPSNHELEFKKKHRPLKLKMLDGSVKTVLIDESLTVQQLVDYCCDKLTINNPEEFSIGLDIQVDEKEKQKKEKDKEISNLTDDGFRWLNPDQALCEQDINAEDILTLKKKFYVSDQNVDRNDPVQLNLVYTQARNQIISEKHPCTFEEAIQFAAIQLQVQTGNHDPNKHKPGFLEVKDYLPAEYQKSKDAEKRIYNEHSKLSGLNDLNAKYRYVQLSRSLRTYGVTFYLVKEKTKKKGVMEPVLLGVTKEKIMRFDVKTKEVIHSWPLTTLRRWAATPNSLTLDFGDHSDAYYTVQTAEGDVISQLIGGYIDIILKKRRDGDRKIEDGQEESMMSESIQRAPRMEQASIMSFREQKAHMKTLGGQSGMMKPMQTVAQVVKVGFAQHQTTSSGMKKGDAPKIEMSSFDAVQQHLQSGYAAINSACVELQYPSAIQPLDTSGNPDASAWKKDAWYKHAAAINSRMVKHVESVAILLNQAVLNKDNIDLDLVGGSIYTLASNLSQLAAESKMIGCFADDNDTAERILDATRKIGSTTAEWLLACQNALEGENSAADLYKVAQSLVDASDELVGIIGTKNGNDEDKQYVLAAAQAIQVEFSNMFKLQGPFKADLSTANKSKFESALNELRVGQAHVLSVSKVILPMLDVAECTQQAIYAAKSTANNCDIIFSFCEEIENEEFEGQCLAMKQSVDRLISLLDGSLDKNGSLSDKVQLILSLTTEANQVSYDADALLGKIKEITVASAEMSVLITAQINQSNDPREVDRLKTAAKECAKRTNELVQETRKWTKDPDNDDLRMGVLKSLNKLQTTFKSVSGSTRETAIDGLTEQSQKLILNTSALLNACSGAALSNTNSASQKQLMQAARKTFMQNSDLAGCVVELKEDPTSVTGQLKLIQQATESVKVTESLVKAIKTAKDTIADPSIKKQVTDQDERVQESIDKLKQALATISCFGDIGGPDYILDSIVEQLKKNQKEMAMIKGDISLLEKENVLGDLRQLQDDIKNATKSAIQELLKVKNFSFEGNDQGVSGTAQEFSASFNRITLAGKQIAAITGLERWNEEAEEQQIALINNLGNALVPALAIISKLKSNLGKKGDSKTQSDIDQFQQHLSKILAALPEQKELEKVIAQVQDALLHPQSGLVTASEETRNKLFQHASSITTAYNQLLNANKLPYNELLKVMNEFTKNHADFINAALAMSTQLDPSEKDKLKALLREISDASSTVLTFSKRQSSVVVDDLQLKDSMLNISQKLGGSIQDLLQLLSKQSNNGDDDQMAKISIKKTLEKCQEIIKNCNLPVSISSYEAVSNDVVVSLDKVVVSLEQLKGNVTKKQLELVCADAEKSALEFAVNLSKALYAIGLADSDTVPGVLGFVDINQQELNYDKLALKVELLKTAKTPQEVAQITTDIAKLTNQMMQLCKDLSAKPQVNQADQQYFVQYAQYIQQSVTGFVGAVKQFSVQMSDENRQQTMAHATGISEGIKGIIAYLKSPQFAGQSATFSAKSLINHKPVLDANKKFFRALDGTANALSILSLNPNNASILTQLGVNNKLMKDAKTALSRALNEQSPDKKKLELITDKLGNLLVDLDATLLKCTTEGLTKVPGAKDNQTLPALSELNKLIDNLDAFNADATYVSKTAMLINDQFDQITKLLLAEASIKDNKSKQCDMVGLLKDLTESILDLQHALRDQNDVNDNKSKSLAKIRAISAYWASSDVLDTLIGQAKSNIMKHQNTILTQYSTVLGAIVPLATFLNECRELIMSISGLANSVGKEHPELEQKVPLLPLRLSNMTSSLQIALKVAEPTTKTQIDANIKLLATGLSTYLDMLRNCIMRPNDTTSKSSLNSASRECSSRVGILITSVKNANPGLSQTEAAVSKINDDVLNAIEGTLIFAEAGQFEPTAGDKKFKQVHEDIQKGVKKLIEDVKGIVSATAQSMNQLGDFSTKAATHLEDVWLLSKSAIASITSADKLTQIELLKSAAAMASAMNELISTAMQVCGKAQNDPEFTSTLPQAAKKAATQVAYFFKAVESVGDDKTRALKAITAVMGDLKLQEQSMLSDLGAEGTALPDDVLKCGKDVAGSVAAMMAAFNKKEELVFRLNDSKKLVDELIRTTRASIENAPDAQKNKMKSTLGSFFLNFGTLLTALNDPTLDKSQMEEAARKVGQAINAITDIAKSMGPDGYVDTDDPNYIAEQELISAANAIDVASKKLAKMVFAPRTNGEEMTFEEVCAEIARAVIGASSALIKAATGVQREISSKAGGKVQKQEKEMFYNDGTWSDGLVSAAKVVVASVGDLVTLVNDSAKGKSQPEKIVVVARSIASSCAHLIASASVKVELESPAQLRLKAAGKQVTGAVENLVKTVEEKIQPDDNALFNDAKQSGVKGRIGEMDAQTEILKMERELERARNRLAGMRKDKYTKDEPAPVNTKTINRNRAESKAEKLEEPVDKGATIRRDAQPEGRGRTDTTATLVAKPGAKKP